MPPSRHSSSSHRSSSSHHSSSSHRSYSSSHSSSSHYSGTTIMGREQKSESPYPQFTRTRRNQPTGYHSSISGYVRPKPYHCKDHDYIYYGTTWRDEETGKTYPKGYYDESGRHYANVVIKDSQSQESRFQCPYCDTEVKTAWKKGAKPVCPNCGAQLTLVQEDEEIKNVFDTFNYTPDPQRYAREQAEETFGIIAKILGAVAIMVGAIAAIVFVIASANKAPKSMYVKEIGRECRWLSQYESYYDQVTDCYFWYNDTIEFPDWQYWYEGISSDYGEFGWNLITGKNSGTLKSIREIGLSFRKNMTNRDSGIYRSSKNGRLQDF